MYAKILEILEETGKKKNKQKTQNVSSQVRREIHVYQFFDVMYKKKNCLVLPIFKMTTVHVL